MKRATSLTQRTFPDATTVARILSARYGDFAHANKKNPLSELLYILCSLQTNEDLYKASYSSLCAAFPTFRLLANAQEDAIATAIVQGGLARQKARLIRQILLRLTSDFGAPTLTPLSAMTDSQCEDYLLSLPGVGKKTARCVMMYSLRRQVFPVDSNCWRISRRLGWVRATRPDRSCSPRDMDRVQAGIPLHLRFSLHVNFVSHGRTYCLPGNTLCNDCCLLNYCRTGQRKL
jgi:endonuclease III